MIGGPSVFQLREEFERINKIVLLNTAAFFSNDVPKRIRFCRIQSGEIFVRLFNGFACRNLDTTKKGIPAIKNGFLYPYKDWKSRGYLEVRSRYSP